MDVFLSELLKEIELREPHEVRKDRYINVREKSTRFEPTTGGVILARKEILDCAYCRTAPI